MTHPKKTKQEQDKQMSKCTVIAVGVLVVVVKAVEAVHESGVKEKDVHVHKTQH